MTPKSLLSAEIDAFEQMIADLQAIAARADSGRRSELVVLRKRLSDQIVRMRDIGVRVFTDGAGSTIVDDFRSRLSTVLHLVAMHQASWPAVGIDENSADYSRSADNVAQANRAFIAWTRAAMVTIA